MPIDKKNEESYDEEEVGNNDEVTDAVGIGGGSEEDRGVQEELERSGMGSDEILECMEENCKCCFLLYYIVYQGVISRRENQHFEVDKK